MGRLRAEAIATRSGVAQDGLDVASIESVDERCLELLREDGVDREHGVPLPAEARAALLFSVESEAGALGDDAEERIEALCGAGLTGPHWSPLRETIAARRRCWRCAKAFRSRSTAASRPRSGTTRPCTRSQET